MKNNTTHAHFALNFLKTNVPAGGALADPGVGRFGLGEQHPARRTTRHSSAGSGGALPGAGAGPDSDPDDGVAADGSSGDRRYFLFG